MTGFGEAHRQENNLAISVELRTINSRYFKLSFRCGEGYSVLEPEVEGVVRQHIRRGTVQVNLQVSRLGAAEDYQINEAVLEGYRRQLAQLCTRWQVGRPVPLESLLELPGVIVENTTQVGTVLEEWPQIEATLAEAIGALCKMRTDEGQAMAADLHANCQTIVSLLDQIDRRAPTVAQGYRARLGERLQALLSEYQVKLDPADIIREVGLFAERSDISEEIVRLRSHLDQFESTMKLPESSGRKLEFLTQEMFREINTIGSKGNDVEISKYAIDIKTAIERIREMVQNVE